MLNYKNLKTAIQILTSKRGLGFAPWRITVSTSGIAPLIENISKDLKAGLAISLHAVSDELRDHLVPINKQYPIQEVLKSCKKYLTHFPPHSRHRRITFEYVMLDGINDSLNEARELARLVGSFPAHVNLIPFNPWPGSTYKASKESRVKAFQSEVSQKGIPCHVRTPRGLDIMAACGQLKSSNESKQSASL